MAMKTMKSTIVPWPELVERSRSLPGCFLIGGTPNFDAHPVFRALGADPEATSRGFPDLVGGMFVAFNEATKELPPCQSGSAAANS
jgi:hypothetical protein